jgi:signal transduction histidine kinase
MDSLANALQYLNIAAFGVLALVCLRAWRVRRGEAAFWAFATFGLLSVVSLTGPIVDAIGSPKLWLTKVIIALVVFFPYFLYRFAISFGRPRGWIELGAMGATAALAVWGLALPNVPEQGEPRTPSFTIFVAALLIQWTALSLFVAARLWRAGQGQPTVVRYRMRLLAVGAVALSVVLILAGLAPANPSAGFEVLQGALTLASAFLFFFGFAPPKPLRKAWREPEEDLLRKSIDQLLLARDPEEVTRTVLPQMANIVGAGAVALLDANGNVLGAHGLEPAAVGTAEGGIRLELSQGAVVAWTSPYAPLFAEEEFELLHSLGGFALLAYERSRLVANERKAFEEADQLKTNFIALASHELRTPAAVVHGIAATLHLRGDDLNNDQLLKLRQTLYEQTERLRRLIDQLLDLSRLEANGIRLHPQPVNVLSRVQDLLKMLVGERAADVKLSVPPELETIIDPDAFDRIISNLIVNAARYGSDPIEISAVQQDRHFRLTVEDRGRGVPPEFVPELFERFTRSDVSKGDRGEGAGLGLAIARSYAQAQGGDLLYEPARPHGARFQLVIPVVHPDQV